MGIVRVLRRSGHEAYFAGGCVRDVLLGIEPKDYDIATGARPEQVRKLFRRSKYVGEAFGVVLVYPGRGVPGAGIEVATFRTEWGYEDGRRPSEVAFTDAEHDAQRRDFTANGLFADPLNEALEPVSASEQRLIDYVGGQADIKAKLLRAIGKPEERFGEDYLRMLRAVRFTARLGFEIEPHTAEAIRTHASKLTRISRERIGAEVRLMLLGAAPVRAVRLLHGLGLDEPVLGRGSASADFRVMSGLCGDGKGEDGLNRKRGWECGVEDENDGEEAGIDEGVVYGMLLAGWMLDRAGADGSVQSAVRYVKGSGDAAVKRYRKALCLSNDERDGLRDVLGLLPRVIAWEDLTVAKRKRLLAHRAWGAAWQLMRVLGPDAFVQRLQREAGPLLAEGVSPEPYVSGDDLISMGFEAGPGIGKLLEAVYDAQLEGRVSDRDGALRWVEDQFREG